MAKKGQLISKLPTVRCFHIAGKIPPFGPKLVVRVMILRQRYLISGKGNGPSFSISIFRPAVAKLPQNRQTHDDRLFMHPF